jgi:hypothetical protein
MDDLEDFVDSKFPQTAAEYELCGIGAKKFYDKYYSNLYNELGEIVRPQY